MFEMIHSGGTFMYVIVGVSVMSFALFFERAGYLYLKLKLNMDKAAKKNYDSSGELKLPGRHRRMQPN